MRVTSCRFQRPPLAILLLLMGTLCACSTLAKGERDISVNVGPSILPNIGVTTGVGQIFMRNEERDVSYTFEIQATFQPWDDEDIHDDGFPGAGNFTQFQLGVKRAWPMAEKRHWTSRAGAVWFRAEGEPNIVQLPGDYVGVYIGFGFERRLGEHLTLGPDLSLLVVTLEQSHDVDFVPQLAYRFTWSF